MKMKIFAVSDIHGHYSELKAALDEAGFSPENKDHLLIVCGDCFDRGDENVAVFNYLNNIQNKILIRGNHEDMLMGILKERRMYIYDAYNGLDHTIADFFGTEIADQAGNLDFSKHQGLRLALMDFMENSTDYFETEHYVFTHGWLPTETGMTQITPSFRWSRPYAWHKARLTPWNDMYRRNILLSEKTVVCGHRGAKFAVQFDPDRDPADSSPFYGKGMIAIDALTVQSKKVNVFITEDEWFPVTHHMNLKTGPFDQIAKGKKRVEMRLFDEKRQKIRIGDEIIFTKEGTGETIRARVLGLYHFLNFGAMLWDFSCEQLGIPENEILLDDYMQQFYSPKDIDRYGTLAIRFALI
jgi:serine/threonine protein phosphatase 1